MANWTIGDPYLDKLGKNLEGLQDKVKEMGEMLDMAAVEVAANKAAHMMALDDLLVGEGRESLATNVLIQSAIKGCELTGEYDFPLYTKRLITAIKVNANGLFKFNLANKSIKVDLSPLGHADQWIGAANAVRSRFQMGESRKAKKPIKGKPAAYQFWMEKIYKPAREGQPVPERQIELIPAEFGGGGSFLQKGPKVSADRSEKYTKVIRARLNEFQIREAPFWQIINYGNTTVGHGGVSAPYPLFGPTYFVEKASDVLTGLFRTSISIYRPKAAEALLGSLVKDLEDGGTIISTPTEDQEGLLKDIIRSDVAKVVRGDAVLPPGKETIYKMRTIEIIYETWTSSLGNVFVRARSRETGKYIKNLLEL